MDDRPVETGQPGGQHRPVQGVVVTANAGERAHVDRRCVFGAGQLDSRPLVPLTGGRSEHVEQSVDRVHRLVARPVQLDLRRAPPIPLDRDRPPGLMLGRPALDRPGARRLDLDHQPITHGQRRAGIDRHGLVAREQLELGRTGDDDRAAVHGLRPADGHSRGSGSTHQQPGLDRGHQPPVRPQLDDNVDQPPIAAAADPCHAGRGDALLAVAGRPGLTHHDPVPPMNQMAQLRRHAHQRFRIRPRRLEQQRGQRRPSKRERPVDGNPTVLRPRRRPISAHPPSRAAPDAAANLANDLAVATGSSPSTQGPTREAGRGTVAVDLADHQDAVAGGGAGSQGAAVEGGAGGGAVELADRGGGVEVEDQVVAGHRDGHGDLVGSGDLGDEAVVAGLGAGFQSGRRTRATEVVSGVNQGPQGVGGQRAVPGDHAGS
jgi:hypothetical protein